MHETACQHTLIFSLCPIIYMFTPNFPLKSLCLSTFRVKHSVLAAVDQVVKKAVLYSAKFDKQWRCLDWKTYKCIRKVVSGMVLELGSWTTKKK